MTTPLRRQPPQQPEYFNSGRMILWSVILVALIGALGYAAYKSGPSSYGGFDVTMKVDADPSTVPVSGAAAGHVKLNVMIQNRTSETTVLNAPAPCKVFRWVLTGAEGELVQASGEECDALTMEMSLKPSEIRNESFEIVLDPTRLKANDRYQFTMEYWGLRGQLVVRSGE